MKPKEFNIDREILRWMRRQGREQQGGRTNWNNAAKALKSGNIPLATAFVQAYTKEIGEIIKTDRRSNLDTSDLVLRRFAALMVLDFLKRK